jgi:hypothetical protein
MCSLVNRDRKLTHLILMLWMLLGMPILTLAGEFEEQLNKGGADRQYLLTLEDKKRLGLFAAMYELAQKRDRPAGVIPKTLHFIWLGPKPFPHSSIENVKGWIDRHPGWKIKFWTDLGHAAPDDRMEIQIFEGFPLHDLKSYYYRCDNFGERSKLLRYAILLNEGGIYIDHDVKCLKALDPLQENHDFFCGLEPFGPSILSSSVNPSPHLLAATANHPVIFAAKRWLINEWERLENEFPGGDASSIYNRVQHRSFRALSIGYKEEHCRAGRKDVVFPPNYFSLDDNEHALYAIHKHRGTWYKQKSQAELKMQSLFSDVAKGVERTYLLTLGLIIVNLVMGILLLQNVASRKKGRKT